MSGTDCYNRIYEKLVKSPDDVAGALAYCFYKEHKKDYCDFIRSKEGREPTETDLDRFHVMSCVPSAIGQYRERGELFVDVFIQVSLTDNARKYLNDRQLEQVFIGLGGVESQIKEAKFQNVVDGISRIEAELRRPRTLLGWVSEAMQAVLATVGGLVIVGLGIWGIRGLEHAGTYIEQAIGIGQILSNLSLPRLIGH